MSLSERRKDDVPFIGSDDFYYETESGKIFDQTLEAPFEQWYNESQGFAVRSELIISEVRPKDPIILKEWLNAAFVAGQQQMIDQMHHLMKHTIME
jgi:hypothetical protein